MNETLIFARFTNAHPDYAAEMILDLLDPESRSFMTHLLPDEFPDDLDALEFFALAQTIFDLHPLAAIALYAITLPYSIAAQ